MAKTTKKRCTRCRRLLPRTRFYPRLGVYRTKDGLRSECKECGRDRFRSWQEWSRRTGYKKPPEDPRKKKDRNLRRNHGITIEIFERMLEDQGGSCAVCRRKDVVLCVDHDHSSGQVRGLLCHSCNRAIGLMGDNWRSFVRAARYLKDVGDLA